MSFRWRTPTTRQRTAATTCPTSATTSVDLGDDEEDVFLEDEEEDGDDVTGIVGVGDDDD